MSELPFGLSVYGVQAPGIDRKSDPFKDITSMGRLYADEIRKVQPEGPYNLLGLCFGGLLAHEVAGLLEHSGREVALLVSIIWTPRAGRPTSMVGRAWAAAAHARDARVVGPALGALAFLARPLDQARARTWRAVALRYIRRGEWLPPRWDYMHRRNLRAMRRHLGSPQLKAPVLLVRPEQGPAMQARVMERWAQYTSGPVTVTVVPGKGTNWRNIIRGPNAKIVADTVAAALKACQGVGK